MFANPRHNDFFAAAIVSAAMVLLIVAVTRLAAPAPDVQPIEPLSQPITVFPDFASINNVDVKKNQFFDYLEDYIVAENARVASLRAELDPYAAIVNSGVALSSRERERVLELAEIYRIDTTVLDDRAIVNELLLRVDQIPVSMALAQAANESAWGTSRFALEGNNIFGEWCFSQGCGIVPRRRPSGASYEVQRFDSIEESITSYFLNINTHDSYRYLRELRAEMRSAGRALDPMALAMGLGRYSQRGDHYVDEVQNIILQNNLRTRDRG